MGVFNKLVKTAFLTLGTVLSLYSADVGTKIYFASSRDGTTQIYKMNSDGTNQQRITSSAGNKVKPKLSNNGKKIVFSCDLTDHWNIYTMNEDGSSMKNISNMATLNADASWSPDDKQIIFSSYRIDGQPFLGAARLVLVNSTTGAVIREYSTNAVLNSEYRPSFSFDGKTILFDSDEDTAYGLSVCTKNADGSNMINLTKHKSWNGVASYSPDGSKIVFVSDREGRNKIYVMNSDGTNPIRVSDSIMDTTYYDDYPCWSPNGERVAFTSFRDSNQNIYSVNSDGSGLKQLTDNPSGDAHPFWAIDPNAMSVIPSRSARGIERKVTGNSESYSLDGKKHLYDMRNRHIPSGIYIVYDKVQNAYVPRKVNVTR